MLLIEKPTLAFGSILLHYLMSSLPCSANFLLFTCQRNEGLVICKNGVDAYY